MDILVPLVIGFVLGLPVGPAGAMAIEAACAGRHRAAIACEIGKDTAIGLVCAIVTLFLGPIAGLMADWRQAVTIASALFLFGFGYRVFAIARSAESDLARPETSFLADGLQGFLVTAFNPWAWVMMTAIVGERYSAVGSTLSGRMIVPLGVYAGALLWVGLHLRTRRFDALSMYRRYRHSLLFSIAALLVASGLFRSIQALQGFVG